MIEMPDVNVLIALFDGKHVHHKIAEAWFSNVSESGWATCPLSENGFIRIVSTPNFNLGMSVSQVTTALRLLIADSKEEHHFWADDISLRDEDMFLMDIVQGYRQLTDLYLLGLCQKYKAQFVTLDLGIGNTSYALVNAHTNLINILR